MPLISSLHLFVLYLSLPFRFGPCALSLVLSPLHSRPSVLNRPHERYHHQDKMPSSSSSSSSTTSSSSSTPTLPSASEIESKTVEATKEATQATLSGLRSLVAGGVGGVCAVVVGHPFDLVKVRLQTAERGVYTGAIDVVRKTVAREGLARVSFLQFVAW